MTKIENEMGNALAAYSGPVKQCRPGKARGADLPKKDDRAQQWLNAHRSDAPVRDKNAERRKRRMEGAERDRIAKRNALVRKRKGRTAPEQTPIERGRLQPATGNEQATRKPQIKLNRRVL